MCLTCGARARSVVTMEAVRTQHGWMAKGKIESAKWWTRRSFGVGGYQRAQVWSKRGTVGRPASSASGAL